MKKIFTIIFSVTAVAVYAQPKLLTQATITTKTTIVTPEGDEPPPGNFTSDNEIGRAHV